ncbi:DedA family protein [Ilumatobacter sp.]|jgi:membrane protein DedA with SNARE-associated domain|uniref:DedA family protein n=1 Tax=Ilumatobacter sp. TaxID=1967498 RepID=UPI003AF41A19
MPVLANIVTDASDWLADFSSNWYFLVIIFLVAYLDSVVPLVPSETMVIIGGVAAGRGDQLLIAVIAAGAVGAFLGDTTAYLIGNRMSGFIERRAADRPKSRQRLDWAREQIQLRGGPLLITARFIPGGRTALTITSGITNQPRGWFMGWVAIAVAIWATYAALLGFVGGQAFQENHTLAFLLAFGTALGMTLLIEGIRHLRNRN